MTKMVYGYFLKTSELCRNKDSQGRYFKARINKTIRVYAFRTLQFERKGVLKKKTQTNLCMREYLN